MKKIKPDISSAGLHWLAMGLMLCDHLWATVVPGNGWLTCLGRIAYPIFAFLLVEGYFHTRNLKKYALRLFVFAVISEIPFNLMYVSAPFYPLHQNVIWTLLIGLGMIHLNERAKHATPARRLLRAASTVILGALLGLISFADYNAAGVLTILVFYFFRGHRWWSYAGQFACLYYLNFEVLKGLSYELTFLGRDFFFPQQGFALLALIPIWLYRGRKGHTSPAFRWFCYGFYPAHMLLLYLVRYFE